MGNETRKLPTRPGWWWGQYVGPLAETISNGPDMIYVDPAQGFDDGPNWQWLAPIPGPAVLAALAEYGEAVMQRGPMQARGVSVSGALLALEDAIRAERDGGA